MKIKAWAVLTPGETITPYGNGAQFQYPIFGTREEARSWKAEDSYGRGKIVRVYIESEELNVTGTDVL